MTTGLGLKADGKWRIYSYILLFQALYSLLPWFLWWLPSRYAAIIFFMIHGLFLLSSNFWDFKDDRRKIIALIVIILFQYQAIGGNFVYHIIRFCDSISLLPLVFLKPLYHRDLLDKFQKIMAPLLALSLVFWIGHLVGYDLPSREITYGTKDRGAGDDAQYYFSNHLFYLVNEGWLFNTGGIAPDFLRFSSVFLEPGYLAILMVFLLFINRFEIKNWKNIVFALTILFSLSLAGFVMAVLAYAAQRLESSRVKIVSLTIVGLVVLLGYYFFSNYNGGDNVINEAIIQRLEYDESSGSIAGYNRTSEYLDDSFEKFIFTSDVVFGINREGYSKAFGDMTNVGYKVYIITHGLFGLTLFLLFLYLVARLSKTYKSYVLLLLYVIMFMRGHHVMWYFGFVLVYVCGVMESRHQEKKSSHRRSIGIFAPFKR